MRMISNIRYSLSSDRSLGLCRYASMAGANVPTLGMVGAMNWQNNVPAEHM